MSLRHLIKHRINLIITMQIAITYRVIIALIVNGERHENYDSQISRIKFKKKRKKRNGENSFQDLFSNRSKIKRP